MSEKPQLFRHSIPIGKVHGITIDLDYSWFLIIGLLAWILAASYYPSQFHNWTPAEYWITGVVTAIMLFVSVLIHELGHSVVAIHYGLSVPRITLFLFGGVSQIAAEPPSATAEFWISIVGPLTSLVLAALFWELEPLAAHMGPLLALVEYLALINLTLALFNLIPDFLLTEDACCARSSGGSPEISIARRFIPRLPGAFSVSCSFCLACGRLWEETFSEDYGSRSSGGSWKALPEARYSRRPPGTFWAATRFAR